MKRLAIITLAAMLSVSAVYASTGGQEAAKSGKNSSGEWAHAPLIQVMHDLAFNFSRLQFGIFTNNRPMIKDGASAIAVHPFPEEGIRPFLKKRGKEAEPIIPESIGAIKKTAAQLADAADKATMLELQQKANVIAEICVGCHDLYRD